MLEQQELRTKLWTKSFIALTISALFLFMNLQMLLSSFPSYVKSEFQAGDIMVSLVTSVFALTAIASRFMTAFLMRKVSRNVLLYIGLANCRRYYRPLCCSRFYRITAADACGLWDWIRDCQHDYPNDCFTDYSKQKNG